MPHIEAVWASRESRVASSICSWLTLGRPAGWCAGFGPRPNLLAQEEPIDTRWIPQVMPADLYGAHLAGLIEVADATGRLFATLCLARAGRLGVWFSVYPGRRR